MKTAKMIFTILGLTWSVQSFAGSLSGQYTVLPGTNCDLQANTTDTIQASASGLTMNLLTNYVEGGTSVMFSANVGDQITRPEAKFAAMGAQTVRIISGYSAGYSEFDSAEYRYAANVSDQVGTATGLFMTVRFRNDSNGGLLYDKAYSDGEQYHCQLIRTR